MKLLDYDNLEYLRDIREGFELTLREAAEGIGISEDFLSKIERGKRTPSEHVLENMNDYYRWIESTFVKKDLSVSYDYFRVTFKSIEVEKILATVFKIDFDQLIYTDRTPFYGYQNMMYYSGIYVCWSNEGNRIGTMIEMKGVGTRLFTCLLEDQQRTWEDVFSGMKKFEYNVGRLDIAVDDFVGYLDIPTLVSKVKRREFDSQFKKVTAHFGYREDDRETGSTIYFGSRKSDMHFCFYQKNIEQAEKLKKEVWEIDIINRYEIRLMNDYADVFIDQLLTKELVLGEMAMGLFRERVKFLTLKRDGSGELKEWKKWEDFVGKGVGLKLSVERIKRSYEQTLLWLVNQTFPSLKAVRMIEERLGVDRLDCLYEQVELSEDKQRFVEEACNKLGDISI